jgi:hypothetical protein
VRSVPMEYAAAERARWLAELASTLDQAHEVLMQLAVAPEKRVAMIDLHVRIEAARLEIRTLRLSRSLQSQGFDPNRSQLSPKPCRDNASC